MTNFNSASAAQEALKAIKAVVDAFDKENITITCGNDDSDYIEHIYSINVIMACIRNHTYAGLGLNIPDPRNLKKGDQRHGS